MSTCCKKYLHTLFIFIFALTIGMGTLRADVTGAIRGTLHDTKGAVIPNASVTITNTATNISQTATTDAEGLYSFPALAPIVVLSPNAGNVSVNGQPEEGNAFLVNGGDANESKDNGAVLVPA